VSREDRQDGKLASHCVVMARSPMDLRELAVRPGWHAVSPRPGTCAWSDQYCDVVGLFLAGRTLNLGPRTAVARPR
jgi:hypothetical protein